VGGVSALAYARKIAESLTTILPYTLGTVVLPLSSEMAAARDSHALATTLTRAVRAITPLFLLVTVGLMVLHQPFIQLLFERAAFTAASTQLTAGPLLFYALAPLPFALEVIVVRFHFARQDTLTPVIADIVAFVLNVALIPPLMAALGLGGIALAAAISRALKVLALLMLFERRVPAFRTGSLGNFAGQMILASLAAVAVLTFLPLNGFRATGQGLVGLAGLLAVGAAAGSGTFFVVAYLLRVEEVFPPWCRCKAWCQARLHLPDR